ncbi:MAG: RIP metalloprotease RseP [Alysiella sp.]|uniref:RIP metalloprotease RseP n=1 Tax=Alysiella sp. TaxID=1872483 RepID=UPI0026DC20E3|nr:RIP metalloprotease RseP [Alysiella sp.]MDO4433142.1 RIP metalloprotease RseP [Alysiella sp.]
MQTIIAFLVAILLLVSLHELGHLIVARLCGIKVLRFSVGFGKPFLNKTWRNIEWCLAPIPLGGYVKMVDTREGNVDEADLPYAFDKQHPLKRIAVVAAGPLTNLVLAVLLYAFSFGVGGVSELRPYVGTVYPQTIAQKAGFQAGDKILTVNGRVVDNFANAQTQMILDLEAGPINVLVQTVDGQQAKRVIDAAGTPEAEAIAKRHLGLGMSPYRQTEHIGMVVKGKPAEKAGLQAGDKIIAINGITTPTWDAWTKIVRENAGRNLHITYLRNGKEMHTHMLPESRESPDKSKIVGYVGLSPASDEIWTKHVRQHFYPTLGEAVQLGWDKMVGYTVLTTEFFGKLVTGQASLSHISGPVTIADVAGQTARIGWQPYVEFLALVSISLGVMNLLPIPVLDGGHLVYYTIEWIRGKPLSNRVQEWGLRFGVSVMLAMMILAFFNDITRLFG